MSEEGFLEAAMRMRDKLYHAAMAILWNEQAAADAVQEAMLKGWKRRDSLRDEALFEVWFMRILINQCRDCQRRQIRRRKIDEAGKRQAALSAPPAACDGLFEAIHALPVAQRLAVLLYYFDGYSQKEIAGILDCTPERVKSMMRQARGRLRAELTRGEEAGQKKGGNGFG